MDRDGDGDREVAFGRDVKRRVYAKDTVGDLDCTLMRTYGVQPSFDKARVEDQDVLVFVCVLVFIGAEYGSDEVSPF